MRAVSKSMTAAILVMFAGYTVASYGYVLLRGWDIGWRDWVDPLHAYQWPAGGVPDTIPPGRVFPHQESLANYGSVGAIGGIAQKVANTIAGSALAGSGG